MSNSQFFLIFIYMIFAFLYMALLAAAVGAQYVGWWFTFKKMGMPGWKGIIPYYNLYCLFKELWDTKQFKKIIIYSVAALVVEIIGYIIAIIGVVFGAVGGAAYYDGSSVAGGMAIGGIIAYIAGLLVMLSALVFAVLIMVVEFKLFRRLTNAFNLSGGWTWGLLFLPAVFFLIIGLNKNFVYYGRVDGQ